MTLFRKILSIIFVFCFSINALAEDVTGSCGSETLKWTLSDEGVLTISGNGQMWNYEGEYINYLWDKTKIKKVIVNGGSNIGNYAFKDCANLTTVSINSSGFSSIGDCAFMNCALLPSITIPATVSSIGMGAFSGCSILSSLTIPDGVTTIGNSTFYKCSNLETVVIPTSVKTIGNFAFEGCVKLKNLSSITNVTTLGTYAFHDCQSLPSINISGVKSIGTGTFKDCTSLASATLSPSATTIDEAAFMNCSSLKTINYPSLLTVFSKNVFNGCSSLEKISISDEITSIDVTAFKGCTGVKEVFMNSNYIMNPTTEVECIRMTDYFEPEAKKYTLGNNISKVREGVFENCTGMEVIEIANKAVKFNTGVFKGCTSLKSMDFTSFTNLTSIPKDMFNGCSSLASVTLPSNLNNIDDNAFKGCASLASIEIPANTYGISAGAFSGCTSLKTLVQNSANVAKGTTKMVDIFGSQLETCTLNSTVGAVATGSFKGCTNLKTLFINTPNVLNTGNSINEIFEDNLVSVTIGNNITSIGDNAFKDMSNLKTAKLGSGLTSIGEYAFKCCGSLNTINIPASVTKVGDLTFDGCESLPDGYADTYLVYYRDGATIREGTRFIGRYINCSTNYYINSVIIPSSVEYIADEAFLGESRLFLVINSQKLLNSSKCLTSAIKINDSSSESTLVIGEGITNIPAGKFDGCGVFDIVVIPSTMKTIGKNTFTDKLSALFINSQDVMTSDLPVTDMFGSSVEQCVLAENITSVGANKFKNCTKLWRMVLYTCTSVDYSDYRCYFDQLDNLDRNENKGLKYIGNSAFEGCSDIRINFQDVETIGKGAFKNAEQMSIIGGTHLKSIGDNAFQNTESRIIMKSIPFVGKDTGIKLLRFELTDDSYIYTGEGNNLQGLIIDENYSSEYTRTDIKNQWGTLVLPFTVYQLDNYTFYSLSAASGSTLTLTKIDFGDIAAGTPVLVHMNENAKDETGKYMLKLWSVNETMEATTTIVNPEPVGGLALTGTYEMADVADNSYIISNDAFWNAGALKENDNLWKDSDGQTIAKDDRHVYNAPFRAYLAGTMTSENTPQQITLKIKGYCPFTIDDVRELADILLGKSKVTDVTRYDKDGKDGLTIADQTFIIKILNDVEITPVTPGSSPMASDGGIKGE